jgi:hypothetical protein
MMMNENKIHLIPQAILDCAADLVKTKNENVKVNYIVRLETIRDYCDQVLKAQNEVRWVPPIKTKMSGGPRRKSK